MSDLGPVLRRNLRRALSANDLDEAALILERLRAQDPLGVETGAFELELHLRSRKHAEAEALATHLVARFPGSARVLYLAGRLAYLRKRYPDAERLLEESLRLEPHWWTLRLLGKTWTQTGRFDDAEAALLPLADEHPVCLKDLAWLHERKGHQDRAVACLQRYTTAHPRDSGARANLQRLRAAALDPGELVEEIDRLIELGQEVSPNLWPPYVEAALRLGRRDAVASTLRERSSGYDAHTTRSVAWVCYRMQAHDMAFEMFRCVLADSVHDVKFLTAFEAAARRCGRVDEVTELYRPLLAEAPALHGRLKRLARREREGR